MADAYTFQNGDPYEFEDDAAPYEFEETVAAGSALLLVLQTQGLFVSEEL